VERIRILQVGLGREGAAWKGRRSALLLLERKKYLDRVLNALAALDDARHVLRCVAARL
jgi:hypothetical protein